MARILLIDDDDDIREVAQLSLEAVGGWEVISAASGSLGVAAARRERPDAILLDVMMPDMDGPTTLRHLRSGHDTEDIPVIFLTAKVHAGQQHLSGLGAAGVIAKPFDPMTLVDEVSQVLGWAR